MDGFGSGSTGLTGIGVPTLVVINSEPNGFHDPSQDNHGIGSFTENSNMLGSFSSPIKSAVADSESQNRPNGREIVQTYIAKVPFTERFPDPNKQSILRGYLDPNIKSIYDVIKPGILPWQDGYDFTDWTIDTLFIIKANCHIPIMEDKAMSQSYLEYSKIRRSQAKNPKKQAAIIVLYKYIPGRRKKERSKMANSKHRK